MLELNGSPFHTDVGLHPFRALIESRCGIEQSTDADDRLKAFQAANVASGSARPNQDKVGKVTRKQLLEIVKLKQKDLNSGSEEAAVRTLGELAMSNGASTVLLAGDIYENYGYFTTVASAIACWAVASAV